MTLRPDVRLAFDRAAADYDQYAIIQGRVARKLLPLLTDPHPLHTILEIGCGTGLLTELVLENNPLAHYYATDVAPTMVLSCQNKLKNFQNLKSFVMDGEAAAFLPQMPSHYDLICSSLAFQWLQDLSTVLRFLWERTDKIAFSTVVSGTFREWESLYSQEGLSCPIQSFWQEDDLLQLCKSLNPRSLFFELQEEIEVFDSPLDFVRSLKKIGAHTPVCTHPLQGGDSSLRALLASYPKDKPFSITYRVAYCILSNILPAGDFAHL